MKAKIVYLGDSIVAWNPSNRYIKFGIPGHTTIDMYWTLTHRPEIQGDFVILSLGVNDIISHYPKKISFESYEKLLRLLEQRFSHILLLSLLPTDSIEETQRIREYNQELSQKKFPFCNLFEAFLDEKKERIAPPYTTDGTHLSHLGYALFNELLDSFMKPFFSLNHSGN